MLCLFIVGILGCIKVSDSDSFQIKVQEVDTEMDLTFIGAEDSN